MPKKPRQIHLAQNVSQKFFELYETVSACRARVRALANQYDIVFDDSIDASDPYIDHDHARKLGGQIIDAQKLLLLQINVMDQYSMRTGYSADPILFREITDTTSSKRSFLYTTDVDREVVSKETYPPEMEALFPNTPTKSMKKVRFAEGEPESPLRPGGSFLELVTDPVGSSALKIRQAVSPLRPSRPDTYDAVLEDQPLEGKSKGKRLHSADHHRSSQPTKLQKIWHENVWPEAYSREDVGNGLDRPMTSTELADAGMPVPVTARQSCARDDMWQCLVKYYGSRKPVGDHKKKEGRNDLSNLGTDLVVYRQKPVVAVPVSQSNVDTKEEPTLIEVKNNVTESQKHRPRAMGKLQLPCSVQGSMLESKDTIV